MRGDTFAKFALARGASIPDRCMPLMEWAQRRLRDGTWSFGRVQERRTATFGMYRGWDGNRHGGANFAAQDYLGLAHDERVTGAVRDAIGRFGIHGAGSEVNGGTTRPAEELAERLGRWLGKKSCLVFPTGWAAGYAGIRGLVRKSDFVLIDRLAHNCLREGAIASGATIVAFEHNDIASLSASLREIREREPDAAILVVVESLYSMDSDGPDIAAVAAAARSHGAFTLLDCAHDLGIFGRGGRGLAEDAGALGGIDFVVGSFSKSFATTGGFLASDWRQCTLSVQAYGQANTFSNQLGPLQAAAATAALEIIASPEGDRLRAEVLEAAAILRDSLAANGLECLGIPSALVPVSMGAEATGREAARRLSEHGILANFIEYPAVALGASRLRLQVSPAHLELDLGSVGRSIARTCDAAAGWIGRRLPATR